MKALGVLICAASVAGAADWSMGTPIVTYWCGPLLTDQAALQMVDGGFNLAWCSEQTLAVARRHGLRAMLQDALLDPASLDRPEQRKKLDELIDRVKLSPALYAYFITDEPSASQFAALGRLVGYLRERDPAHLAYINLFPTYASNQQLGNTGEVTTAYRQHLRQFIETVKPALISYDHYQFALNRDSQQYFLNLSLVRQAALDAGIPFLNIIQASTWAPNSMRVPGSNEVRYLVYTTAAYGAQGISYYIYSCPNHLGGMASADGRPTSLYYAVKDYNREFTAIMRELQPLRSLAVWHTNPAEPGCLLLPDRAPFRILSPPTAPSRPGLLLGYFGNAEKPTHVLVVNLDYRAPATVRLAGPAALQKFSTRKGRWSRSVGKHANLHLPPGGGQLVRLRVGAPGDARSPAAGLEDPLERRAVLTLAPGLARD